MRKFNIKSHTHEGEKEDVVSVNGIGAGAHAAATEFLQRYHPTYQFTGVLQVREPSLWRGEAYNATHGLVLWVREL